MAGTIRNQHIPGVPYPDGVGKGNVSLGRHTLFGSLSIFTPGGTPKVVGGMQAFRISESNGTNFRAMAGNDWNEPVFGMRQWQGSGSRFQLRGADMQELLAREYSNLSDIDFRMCPFIWQYSFNYQGPSGAPTVETATWSWMTVWITEYTWSFSDPMTLISEDFNFIGKGYNRSDMGGEYQLSNLQQLWGAGKFADAGGAAPAAAPTNQTPGSLPFNNPNMNRDGD